MDAGKCPAFQNAVDDYIEKIKEIIDELNNFGDTAMRVVVGGMTDGSDMEVPLLSKVPILGKYLKTDGKQDWSFLAAIEAALRRFVVGSAGTEGGSATGIMQYMCSIGISIALIFFLISILQLVTEDRFTPEFLVKFFAKFIIAFCVILWSPDILAYIIDFGDALAVDVAQKARGLLGTTETFDPAALEALIKNHAIWHYKNVGWDGWTGVGTKSGAKGMDLWGVWEAFKFWIEGSMLGIFKFISYLLNAVVMLIVLTRIMELYIRGAFFPIAAGLMSDDGWRGTGGRYFRKLMSLATQSAAIMMVANVFSVMMQAAIGSIFASSILGKYEGLCHDTLDGVANCTKCLNAISTPLNVPVMKPMMICIVLCVAGLATMFKAASMMDDLWGAR